MKRITLVVLLIAALITNGMAQGHPAAPRIKNSGKTDKIGLPGPGAFYDEERYNHDGHLEPDFQNNNDKLIKNLPEKKGTFVLNGKRDLAKMRKALEHPEEMQFESDYVEFPYKDGQTNYRVPVFNISNHHELTNAEVAVQMRDCIQQYRLKNEAMPGAVYIRHDELQAACYFYPYTNIEGKGDFAFAFRLNMGCVRIRLLKSSLEDYVKK